MFATGAEPSSLETSLHGWPRAVMATMALLMSLLSTHLVRLTWFDASPPQPLNRPAPSWNARPALPLAMSPRVSQLVINRMVSTAFADSAFLVLGRPARPIGVVDSAGRDAQHIG